MTLETLDHAGRAAPPAAVLLLTLPVAGAAAPAQATTPRPGAAALDAAFKFASSIQADPGDRGKAQFSVIGDFIARGDLDEAAKKAGEIEGWQRGAAWADLAAALARVGRADEARGMLGKAEEFRKGITGWENPRIGAHIAQALAALGDLEASRDLAVELATSDREYAGRSAATVASGKAVRADFPGAMKTLAAMDEEKDYEVAWWRTAGYLSLARRAELSLEDRRKALLAARRSADGIEGWKRAEALASVAAELLFQGDPGSARGALKVAETVVRSQASTMPMKAPLMSNLARAWGKLGDARRARPLLEQALGVVPNALVIDRPGLYANLAASYLLLGENEQGERLLDRAFAAAEALENARPRALAVVSICRVLGQNELGVDGTKRARLDALFENLRAPW
jgi:tetratricopeptide (TPR) repeat protein